MEGESVVAQSSDEDEIRIEKLLAWAKEHHIWMHDDAQIGKMTSTSTTEEEADSRLDDQKREQSQGADDEQDDDTAYPDREKKAKGSGFSVCVKPGGRILERQVITLVPKSSLLSVRTSSLAPYLPKIMFFSSDASSGMLLSLVLLHELMLGKEGPWWGYLQSLPREKGLWGLQLPFFLSKTSSEWRMMAQSEAGRMIKRTEADPMGRIEGLGMSLPRLQHFFKANGMIILKQAHPAVFEGKGKDFDHRLFGDYIRAHSIISSRTFIVDMYHGMCLAPISDMYNHSGDASVHFEADDEVCDECGSLGACPHNDDPLPSEAYGRPSAFLPAKSGPNSVSWMPPIGLQGVDTVDMVAQQDLDAEEEAYNTYGNFSNASLLTTYGFCLEYETEWERYVWEWRNKEEREELLSAMGVYTPQRRKAVEEKDQLEEWVDACVAFSHLPRNSFAELLAQTYPLPQTILDDPSNTINMPVFSPFVALTQSATQDGVDTVLDAALENVLTPLSTHDGSRDSYQPLYVDHQGRISLSLWRAILLFSLTEDENGRKEHGTDNKAKGIRHSLHSTEMLFSEVVALDGDNRYRNTRNTKLVEHSKVLYRTLNILLELVNHRLESIKATRNSDDEDNLSVVEKYKPGLLRSAALQSFQERTALAACSKWLARCIDVVFEKNKPQ